ncbi:MAG TPA: zf-HC2 domain-containing protein, partial [Gemmatimonadaceae bacterium]|nr:zf-HC2 domain-containing protein [Gemmatimonadaceae bacterium]
PESAGADAPRASRPDAAAIDCETAVRRLWDYLDGGLIAPARSEVEAHIATCAKCAPHFTFAAATLTALASARPAALTKDADAALRARVRTVLGEAASH